MTETTAPTLDERLSTASTSSNLLLKPNTTGHVDLLIAAGRAPKVLGRHLIALYGEWDGHGKPRKPTPHAVEQIAKGLPRIETGMRKGKPGQVTPNLALDMKQAQQLADDWHEAERVRLFGRLKSLARVRDGLVAWATLKGIEEPSEKVNDVLMWWLDHQCPKCDGTKLEPLPIGGRGAIRACKPCQGTGERLLPHKMSGRLIETKINECVHKARQQIGALHWGHQLRD